MPVGRVEVEVNRRKISTLRSSRTDDNDGVHSLTIIDKIDGDDSSSSTSSESYLGFKIRKDLRFAIPSNIIFFVGSILYLNLAVRDYQYEDKYYTYYPELYYDYKNNSTSTSSLGDVNNTSTVVDSEDRNATGNTEDTENVDSYTIISILAASAFILNALVDLARCVHYKHNHSKVRTLWHSDIRADFVAAVLFGVAACIDLWASIMTYYIYYGGDEGTDTVADYSFDEDYSARLNGIASLFSTQIYVLSAVAAIMGLDWDWNNCKNVPYQLGVTGDILFLIGSIIDVLIAYMYAIPAAVRSVDPMILLKLSLVSSTLWLIDSILYLTSDGYLFLLVRRHRCNSNEKGIEGMEITSDIEMKSRSNQQRWFPNCSSDWTERAYEGDDRISKMDNIFS